LAGTWVVAAGVDAFVEGVAVEGVEVVGVVVDGDDDAIFAVVAAVAVVDTVSVCVGEFAALYRDSPA
jgi:hypothetical protein